MVIAEGIDRRLKAVAATRLSVLHYQGIGDSVLSLPLFHWFRRRAADHWLQVVTPRERFGLFAGLVDRALTFGEVEREPEMVEGLVLDLDTGTTDRRYRELIAGLRCRRMLGFEEGSGGRPRSGECVRVAVAPRPMWRQYLGLGRELLERRTPACFQVRPPLVAVPPRVRRRVARHTARFGGRPLVACAPGAGLDSKRWPPAHFARVLGAVQSGLDAAVVLIGSEEERPLGEPVVAAVGACNVLDCFGWDLVSSAAVLEACAVTLANDSAMLHLAAAMGTPVVGVYGEYCSPQTHRPFGTRYTLLYAKGRPPSRVAPREAEPHVARYLAPGQVGDPWRATGRVVML